MLEKQSLLILRGGIAAFQGMPDDKFFDEEFIHLEVKKRSGCFHTHLLRDGFSFIFRVSGFEFIILNGLRPPDFHYNALII